MKYFIIFFSILSGILLTAASCKKNVTKDPLPAATQTGANTMGFFINGKAWLPDTRDNGSIPRLKAVNAKFWNITDLFLTFYRDKNPDNQDLAIYVKDFSGIGTYNMNKTSRIIGLPGSYGTLNSYLYFSDYNTKQEYITNENYVGIVDITYYNATNKIVSGTFQFKGQNYNSSSDSVIVSEGRFDCTLY